MTAEKPTVRSASYLSPPDFHRLNWACRPVREAFPEYGVYLVGSVLTRPDFRDIDLRLILPDEDYASLVPNARVGLLLNVALSDLVAKAANLPWPIDFQIQSMTEANVPEHGMRNAMGMPR
jgi:hypothetical protein